MATAVQTSSEPRTPTPRSRLALASVLGALYVIAGVAVAGYVVPMYVDPAVGNIGPAGFAVRVIAQLAAAAAIFWLGTKIVGAAAPRGLRGGIFLALVGLIAIFFIARAVGLNFEGSSAAMPITVGVLVVLLFVFYRFMVSARAERWMHTLDEQGWFGVNSYKRTQGKRARRYTMLGLLLVGWTGVYSAYTHETFGTGAWTLAMPFDLPSVTLLGELKYTTAIALGVIVFWLAWRAVNVPAFADFLIATEAEMNKVSWPSRKRLIQDTIVVLVTCLLLTGFLLVVDLFWGWLLSQRFIGVLPPQSDNIEQVSPDRGREAKW